jgi:predicted Zn-dependent protease
MFPYRRRPRASLVPFIQLLSLVLVFALPALWGAHIYTSSPAHFDKVIVQPGDTVWTLVARRAGAGADVAEAAYNVAVVNHLAAGTQLHPGQVLLIPR